MTEPVPTWATWSPSTSSQSSLIGPLTAEEWCAFRLRDDDDLLQCCAVTSEFRDALFTVLRMGAHQYDAKIYLRRYWLDMAIHGWPGGPATPLLQKLHDYYLPEEVRP